MQMHANSREDVKEARAGDIIAIAGEPRQWCRAGVSQGWLHALRREGSLMGVHAQGPWRETHMLGAANESPCSVMTLSSNVVCLPSSAGTSSAPAHNSCRPPHSPAQPNRPQGRGDWRHAVRREVARPAGAHGVPRPGHQGAHARARSRVCVCVLQHLSCVQQGVYACCSTCRARCSTQFALHRDVQRRNARAARPAQRISCTRRHASAANAAGCYEANCGICPAWPAC